MMDLAAQPITAAANHAAATNAGVAKFTSSEPSPNPPDPGPARICDPEKTEIAGDLDENG